MSLLEKIFEEQVVSSNEHFLIVNDIDPICDRHILAFSRRRCSAFLGHRDSEIDQLFFDMNSFFCEPFLFFERGNASFCTSIDGPICAHIHFFPKKEFNPLTLLHLVEISRAQEIVIDKSTEVGSGEYLCFGNQDKMFYSVPQGNLEKRYLRNYFKANCYG